MKMDAWEKLVFVVFVCLEFGLMCFGCFVKLLVFCLRVEAQTFFVRPHELLLQEHKLLLRAHKLFVRPHDLLLREHKLL
jgi:hypothetical protein